MQIKREQFTQAAEAGVISAEQAEALWCFLGTAYTETPAFRPAHILYYLGGLIAISAVSFFVTLAWDSWAGWPMLGLATAFAILGLALTHYFLDRKQLPIPAGIMITFTVAITPLAVYSLQRALGLWEGDFRSVDFHRYIDWRWIFMELATLAAAAIAFWRYRMPFLLFPTALVLWYLQMDLVPFIFNELDHTWELRKLTSVVFGLAMILFAFWVDVRSGRRKDYAFWLYLFGVLTFWCGLSLLRSDSELNKFLYFLINIALLVVGTLLSRRVFAVFAAFGILGYLGYLTRHIFQDSLVFPVAVAAIGIGIIFLGVQWQRHEQRLNELILGVLPGPVRDLVARVHQ
jgi:hypothetical protein